MLDTSTEPVKIPALQKHLQQLEVDTFCEGCGYNLHGQPVERDERTQIIVCRCPECGKYHPAGRGITATSQWLMRLGTLALGIWVLLILFAAVWISIAFAGLPMLHVDAYSHQRWVAVDGREITWDYTTPGANTPVYAGTTQPATAYGYVRFVEPGPDDYVQPNAPMYWMMFAALLLGFITGALLVVFFWHWKRKRYPLMLVWPYLTVGVVMLMAFPETDFERVRVWAGTRMLGYATIEALGMILGILFGRPIVRGLLRMFIPDRPRQVFAFLWRADGKSMPPVT